jgi:hypothetical protein
VLDPGVGELLAGLSVVDDLVDGHGDAAVGLVGERLRLDAARDGGELAASSAGRIGGQPVAAANLCCCGLMPRTRLKAVLSANGLA